MPAFRLRHALVPILWTQHYAHLTDADREVGGKSIAELLAEKLPRAMLLELLPKLKNVSNLDIAIALALALALGDAQERRKRKSIAVLP